MFSVALIGADGAGKTTVARQLERAFPLPVKYLYMGINTQSSNVVLPSTRLLERLYRLSHSSGATRANLQVPSGPRKRSGGTLRRAVRLAVNISEEIYRELLSWWYRRQGCMVIYDRHFQFDFEYQPAADRPMSDRLHRWFLAHLYPRPDLVIFLDAPAEVLYARKPEAPPEWLHWRREQFLMQGRQLANFLRVDATQPLPAVVTEVTGHIICFHNQRSPKRSQVLPQAPENSDAASNGF